MSKLPRRSRERLPLVLSITALAVAIFGSTPLGQAARDAVLPRNSVGTAQLKANAVTSAKIRNGTLLRADFARGALPTAGGGAKGDKGDKGDPGPKGDKGDPGPRTPSWGEVTGPGFGSGPISAWRQAGNRITLPVSAGSTGRFFVFGRVNAEVRCTAAGACGQSYALFLNDTAIQQTNASLSGPAGQRTREDIAVFGIVNVSRAASLLGPQVVSLYYRTGTNLAESSIGVSIGAIALG